MRYQEPVDATWADVASAELGGDEAALLDALLGAVYSDPEWKRAQDHCLRLLDHPSPQVRALAVICLGHVARIHGRIDRSTVLAALDRVASDSALAGRVEDARGDIEMFAG